MTGETVYTKTRSNGGTLRIHTDRDCRLLAPATTVRERPRSALSDDAPMCRVCSGEYEPYAAGCDGPYRVLEELDADAVGSAD